MRDHISSVFDRMDGDTVSRIFQRLTYKDADKLKTVSKQFANAVSQLPIEEACNERITQKSKLKFRIGNRTDINLEGCISHELFQDFIEILTHELVPNFRS